MENYFVYGLSGAGKDTISNHLVSAHGFIKLRIADTIKRIICEKHNITFNQLEELKRTNPEFRKAHHEVSAFLTMQSSLNRCKQICAKESFDFQNFTETQMQQPIIICDVRTFDEMIIFLAAGYKGIFLTKRNQAEFQEKSHYTEKNIYTELTSLDTLLTFHKDKMLFINNDIPNYQYSPEVAKMFIKHEIKSTYATNGNPQELLSLIDILI